MDTENTSVPYQTLYNNRQEVPGYAGYRQHEQSIVTLVEKDVAHPNHAMESTAQACYREYPVDHYNPNVELETNKHKGPLSRMVTLTHPFNPFTQQSAYSNSGASSIQ